MVAFEDKKGDHIGLHFLFAQKRIIFFIIDKNRTQRDVNLFSDAAEKYDHAL